MLLSAITLSLTLLTGGKPKAPVPGCRLADKQVERVIARKAAELHGMEYCQFRVYHTLDDLDGDGLDDFVVLFNVEAMEGGNDHACFMAVFLSSRKAGEAPIVLRTGGRGEQDPVAVEVKKGRITLDTLEYLPSDPMCCPSGKGKLVYELSGRALHLVNKPSD